MIATSHYCKLVILNFLSLQILVCWRSAWWSESVTWRKLMHTTWWLTNVRRNLIVVFYLFCRLGLAVTTTEISGVDVVSRFKWWKIAVGFFVFTAKSSGMNDGDSWRLCSGRVKCQNIAVGLLFWQSGLAVRTAAIAGVYVAVGSSFERITNGVVLVY